jgi:hypothetical protein
MLPWELEMNESIPIRLDIVYFKVTYQFIPPKLNYIIYTKKFPDV